MLTSKTKDFGKLNEISIDNTFVKNLLVSPTFIFKGINFYTKKARGLMARYLIQNRCSKLKNIKTFDKNSYEYNETRSTDKVHLFIRLICFKTENLTKKTQT